MYVLSFRVLIQGSTISIVRIRSCVYYKAWKGDMLLTEVKYVLVQFRY